ncbi:type III-B CRISPR module RAMP protein Cmr6 [Methylomusa anaerophila]|uniref:RAMP superfamily protein n=1 Tax=Methylomusa anaerophila TaxID=1930071 RepID=A0A348AQY5_9FIRM|nr:type III-B CRISPR module RAMP protein Cmr6 [Methylomusa anaerophila]BBB93483.1 RAMP superfamily protein [Methylomusa anaerophila]
MSQTSTQVLHPADTQEMFQQFSSPDHLWYSMNYNQQADRQAREKEIDREEKKKNGDPDAVRYMFRKNLNHRDGLERITALGRTVDKQRLQALADLPEHYQVRILQATPMGGIIHGLGGAHVRENSLTIHPVYGFLYIPGSSLKGVVRRWFIEAFLGGKESHWDEKTEPWRQAATLGRLVFGTQASVGAVQFFDIFLIEGLQVKPDILTPHFSGYYAGKGTQAPEDTLNPVPNQFYIIQVQTADIVFTLRDTPAAAAMNLSADDLIGLLTDWVRTALQELGLGGKTSSGYGRFMDIQDVTLERFLPVKEKRLEEKKKEEQRKEQAEEQRRLSAMTSSERLIHDIRSLNSSTEEDIQRSKNDIFNQVLNAQNKEAAQCLKTYWESTNNWIIKRGSKKQNKQAVKVQKVRQLLGDWNDLLGN